MITAKQLIEDALDDLGVKASESELTDSELNDALRKLNRIGVSLAADDLHFGYSKLSDYNSTVTIPDWSEDLFIALLSIRLAPSYNVQLQASTLSTATDLLKIAQKKLVPIPVVNFPSTLPLGAGNNQSNTTTDFFPDYNDKELAVNSINLTDNESVTLSSE